MLANILVTLDRSPLSEAAIPVAEQLTVGTEAVVTLFAVGEPPSATAESSPEVVRDVLTGTMPTREAVDPHMVETRGQAIERRERELEEYLQAKAEPLRDRGIKVQVAVTLGEEAAEPIIDYARDHPVDLIVMATHGHTGLRSLVFGSVAAKVLGSGVSPVLLVRPSDLGHHAP